jgi:hypothetical protein
LGDGLGHRMATNVPTRFPRAGDPAWRSNVEPSTLGQERDDGWSDQGRCARRGWGTVLPVAGWASGDYGRR